jgi:ATP-dependent protease HslVU (ClpYQ) ATPase subunit
VHREALQATEQDGIVFIDEIDKIVTSSDSHFSECPHLPSRLLQQASALCLLEQALTHKEAAFGHQGGKGLSRLR